MAEIKSSHTLRNLIFLILLLAFTGFIVTRFASLKDLASGLLQANPLWLIVAVFVHILYFYLQSVLYHFSFKTVGVNLRAIQLFPVVMASIFINAVAPTGGVGGAAVFVDYAKRHDQPGTSTAVGVILDLISDLASLIPFVIVGIIFLAINHQLRFYEWLGFLFYLIFILGLGAMLVIARVRQPWLKKIVQWIRLAIDKVGGLVKHPDLVTDEWVETTTEEFVDGAGAIAKRPHSILITLFWGTIMHVVNLVGLYTLFLAYHQPINWGTIDAAFSLGIVFFVIAVIPQGVGAVEGMMSLVLISMGIPKTNAAVIALAFRGINFWIPTIAGFIGFQFMGIWTSNLNKKKGEKKQPVGQ